MISSEQSTPNRVEKKKNNLKMSNDDFKEAMVMDFNLIVESRINSGNYIDTDFIAYAKLVQEMIDYLKIDNTSNSGNKYFFFTALSLPPYQWYNYRSKYARGAHSAADSQIEMASDMGWCKYLQIIESLVKKEVMIFRKILCHSFPARTIFRDLAEASVIDSQLNSIIVYHANRPVEPLPAQQIKEILGASLCEKYKCYKDAKYAYLIIDEHDEKTIDDKGGYETQTLKEHMSRFQCGELTKWVYDENHTIKNQLPNDFFLTGIGDVSNDRTKYQFGLTAKSVKESTFVRLWILSQGEKAMEEKPDGKFDIKYSFSETVDFVCTYLKPAGK